MIRQKLLKTLSFRLALWYVGLFAVSATVVFGFIWWAAVTFMLQQTEELIESEVLNLVEHYNDRGLAALSMQISGRQRMESSRANIYLLVDREMRYLAGNIHHWPQGLAPKGYPEWHTITASSDADPRPVETRVLVVSLMGKLHLMVGRELTDITRARIIMAMAMAMGIFFTVIMGLIWGNMMSKRLLGRLEEVNRASREIMAGAMDRRIPVSGSGDEFDRLAGNLNDMLERIEELLATVRQVSDNIAHDLRSPLTRLRSRLELAMLETADTQTQRQAMEEAIDQAQSIIATFNALLTIAKAEAGAEFAELDLSALVGDAAELYEPLAEDKEITLTVELEDGLRVRGNRHLLSQAVTNLLDNAVKYTPPGGRIAVSARRALPGRPQQGAATPGREAIEVSVADSGPGIPVSERENVLKRFYRLDESRGTPGSGLGLSLVAAVARLHGARLGLSNNAPGLAAVLVFPA